MKYSCYGVVTGTKYLGEVEADSPEEAKEKMFAKVDRPCLCHQCTRECEDAEIHEIEVEEVK